MKSSETCCNLVNSGIIAHVHMEDELLTVDEASARLKIHSVTLRKMLREGRVRGMKFGAREWRIPTSALNEFIASKMPPRIDLDRNGDQG